MCRQIKRFQIQFYFLVHLYQNNNNSNRNKTKKYWRVKGVIIVPEYFRLLRIWKMTYKPLESTLSWVDLFFYKNGSQRRLRTLTVERANHNDETTVLLFFNKQHGNTVLTGQRHATISWWNVTLAFCSKTSLRDFLSFFQRVEYSVKNFELWLCKS